MTLRVLYIVLIIISFNSCIQDDYYSVPEVSIKDPKLTANLTISELKKYYRIGKIVPLPNGIIEGYITSTDAGGNIYKTLYIQDKAENPTDALTIGIDATGLYSRYDIGRKVFVKLDGLSIGMDKGMLKIGKVIQSSKGELITIPQTLYKEAIIVTPEKKTIKPLEVNITDLSEAHLGLLIKVNNVHPKTKGLAYYNKYKDRSFGADRLFEDCQGHTITMRISNMATFKSEVIPSKRGHLVGLYSRYNTTYQFIIRTLSDVNLTEAYGCDE